MKNQNNKWLTIIRLSNKKNIMKKYFNISLTVLSFLFCVQQANSQDGEKLFKAKCNACHMVDKNSTGPVLKGVKQKWADAGEAEMLYDWVKNPQNLIASGKSKLAIAIKAFSPADMNSQTVTNEEVDAILDYIDNYSVTEPIVSKPGDPVDPKIPTETKANYTQNLSLFYWLCVSLIILLIGIIVLSSSISQLIQSNFFKKKMIENGGNESKYINTIILLVGFFALMGLGNNSFAMSVPGDTALEGQPWLLIENIDLYFIIVINLILLFVLLYLRGMLKDFLNMVAPPKPVAVSKRRARNINAVLTDVVAIEEEHTILMHHEYDGIRELDNNLPPWWVWMFYATIIFAIIYLFNYHILKTSDLQIEEYDKEMVQAKKDVDAYLSKMAMNVDENNAILLTDAAAISSGKALFETNCVACHNPKGEGNIGPNLTDDSWIYGLDVKDLFKIIKLGSANGMPEHASKLNPIQIQEVSSFVLSLPFTKGKDAEGKKYAK